MTDSAMPLPDSGWDSRGSVPYSRILPAVSWSFAVLLLLAGISLAWFLHSRMPLNFDEYAHLHLGWARSQGLIVGTDYWDNRFPFFHSLIGHLPSFGEAAEASILSARAFTFCGWVLVLAAVFLLARTAFDAPTGLASAAILACVRVFTEKIIEVRADGLMILCCVLSVICILRVVQSPVRNSVWSMAAGACLAAALIFSPKALMLPPALLAGAVAALLRQPAADRSPLTTWLPPALWATAGFLIVFVPMLAYLAMHGVMMDVLRFTFLETAAFPDRFSPMRWLTRSWSTPMAVLFAAGVIRSGWLATRQGPARAMHAFLAGLTVVLVVQFAWLIPSPYPHTAGLAIAFVAVLAGGLLRACLAISGDPSRSKRSRATSGAAVAAILLAAMGGSLLRLGLNRYGDRAVLEKQLALINRSMELTGPNDRVFADAPVALFRRPACYYPALWTGVLRNLESGRAHTTIRDELRRNGCTLVVEMEPPRQLPPEDARYVAKHFVSYVPSFLVPGAAFTKDQLQSGPVQFDAVTPGTYTVYSEGAVFIDGETVGDSVVLKAGTHTIAADDAVKLLRKPGQ